MGKNVLIRELRQELSSAESELQEAERKYNQLSREVEVWREALALAECGPETPGAEPSVRPPSYSEAVSDAIADILRDGEPKHRREILEQVEKKGIVVGGARPINNISARLSQDPRFSSAGNGNWKLTPAPVSEREEPDDVIAMAEYQRELSDARDSIHKTTPNPWEKPGFMTE